MTLGAGPTEELETQLTLRTRFWLHFLCIRGHTQLFRVILTDDWYFPVRTLNLAL